MSANTKENVEPVVETVAKLKRGASSLKEDEPQEKEEEEVEPKATVPAKRSRGKKTATAENESKSTNTSQVSNSSDKENINNSKPQTTRTTRSGGKPAKVAIEHWLE